MHDNNDNDDEHCNEEEDDDDSGTFVTESAHSPVRKSTPQSSLNSSQKSDVKTTPEECNNRGQRRETQTVRFSLTAATDENAPEAHPGGQKKTDLTPVIPQQSSPPLLSPQKSVQKMANEQKSMNAPVAVSHQKSSGVPAAAVPVKSTAIPKPPPPPPMASGTPSVTELKKPGIGKAVLKGAADRRTQFAPAEKNLFRIALECEEEAGKSRNNSGTGSGDSMIKDSSDLAQKLMGNVKSRVASLEVDDIPGKPGRKHTKPRCALVRKVQSRNYTY